MTLEAFLVIPVIAWIGFRAARAVAMDDVGEMVRRWTRDNAGKDPSSRPRRWLVGLVKCAHCIGFWLTILIGLFVTALLLDADWTTDLIVIAAATGLQSMFVTYAQEDQVAMELKPPEPEGTSEAGLSDTVPPEGLLPSE